MSMLAAPIVPLAVREVTVTIVKPLEKTLHVETIEPSINDILGADIFVPVLFAYKLGSIADHDDPEIAYLELLNRLKESLRKVLVPFFPFAGRWVSLPERKRRQLICDDVGVPFMEAFADADLADALRDFHPDRLSSLQGYHVLGLDVTQARQQMRPEGLPSFFVQVTRFKCGGLTLGATFNHSTVDGRGYFDFMRAWSDIATKGETLIVPSHDRTLANAYEKVLPLSYFDREVEHKKWIKPWALKTFQVDKLAVQSMKEDVKKGSNNDGAYVSTLDCISSHIWRSLSRLAPSVTGVDEIGVMTIVEGRSRFYNPPLPKYYVGNVFMTLCLPKVPTSELLERPPTFGACKLREKLLSTSCEAWTSHERFAEASEIVMNERAALWLISSWFSFPMYEVEFGFGKPFFVSPNSRMAIEDQLGVCCVVPPNPAISHLSAATVSITCNLEILEALQVDAEFSTFFLQM